MRGELTYSQPSERRPKKAPGVTAKYRAKRRRAEGPVLAKVRVKVNDRDGFCIFPQVSACEGVSELAHLEGSKRARTRGMKPEFRHTTKGTANACTKHHRMYDAGDIRIALTDEGANGPIRAEHLGRVYMIPAHRRTEP